MTASMNKLTPNLIVDSVEEALPFWTERLGFEKAIEVPDGKVLGFVILHNGPIEVMLQSKASLAEDLPALAGGPHGSFLYVEVADLAPIRKALKGWPEAAPERKTFYGAQEIIVRAPSGHVVIFAAH
jgi:catechol 2,3-dioxygenase-like lactoylglutathione lyase family enzyme